MRCRCLPGCQLRAAVARPVKLTIRICSSISGSALVHLLSAFTWILTITPKALRHFDLLSSRAERHSARFGFGIWDRTEDWSDGSCFKRWSRMGRCAVVGSVPAGQLISSQGEGQLTEQDTEIHTPVLILDQLPLIPKSSLGATCNRSRGDFSGSINRRRRRGV